MERQANEFFFWVVAMEEQSLFFTDFSFKVKEQKK